MFPSNSEVAPTTSNLPNEPVPVNEPLILRPLKSKASIFAKPSPLCKNLNIFELTCILAIPPLFPNIKSSLLPTLPPTKT